MQPSPADEAPDHALAVAGAQFEISTDPVRKRERFDFYCDLARSNYLGFDDSTKGPGEFHGRMKGIIAGSAIVTRTALSPASFTRTRRSMLDHDESVVLLQMRRGTGRIEQAGKELPVTPGVFALYVSSMPSTIELFEHTVRASIKLPRAMLETLLRPGQMIGPTLFHASDPIMEMLTGYVGSYARKADSLGTEAAHVAGRHMAELIALALGANRDAEVHSATDGGLRAARTDAILKAIARDYASPFASPAAIGSSLGISERHVHRLLEETNRTFYEHLLEARLSAAHRVLSDPRALHLSIREVAEQSGFANVTYFNRAFRTRFGDTPSGVRGGRLNS